MFLITITASALCFASFLYYRFYRRGGDVYRLRGPPSTSWLYGNMLEVFVHVPFGEFDIKWQRVYGKVYRIKGCFGEDRLVITDSGALRHITANTSIFGRPPPYQKLLELGFGERSVVAATGHDHRRLREVMNPVFSVQNIRNVESTISKVGGDLVDRLLMKCENNASRSVVIDILDCMHDTTIQSVGEAIMGYRFTDDDGFMKCYKKLTVSSAKNTRKAILLDSIIPYLPAWIITLVTYFPPDDLKHMVEQRVLAENISEKMVRNKLEVQRLGLQPEKDLFSTLVDINSKTNSKMTFVELKQQFGLLVSAGEDTTAASLSWALYELAKNVKLQDELRQEITREQYINGRLDYDKLPILNALIKEVLRYYSPAHITSRASLQDAVIPLSTPVATTTGNMISEIFVKKGQYLQLPIHSYHRLTDLWGDDANEFRPSRWYDGKSKLGDGAAIGPYSSLLAFWGGEYTCVGWRFSIAESQSVLCALTKTFSFSIDDDAPPVYPTSALTQGPSDGKGNFGIHLRITAL